MPGTVKVFMSSIPVTALTTDWLRKWDSRWPKKGRKTKRWRDGDIESPGFLLLVLLITAIYFDSKTSKGGLWSGNSFTLKVKSFDARGTVWKWKASLVGGQANIPVWLGIGRRSESVIGQFVKRYLYNEYLFWSHTALLLSSGKAL